MKSIFTILCFSLMLFSGMGQTLTVREKITRQPLELVTVYTGDLQYSALTDAKGRADISALRNGDSIHVRIIGYEPEAFTFKELEEMKFAVYLNQIQLSLDEVVVAASRWEQEKRNVPNRIVSIRPSEVSLQNPQTAADLLGSSGEVFIQKSQLGGGSPMIRGFSANRVLITVDGVRMNNAIFRSGNIQNVISLDPFALERTEVFFGPGSVIYGSDAMGGVMGFYTLTPKLSLPDKGPLIKGNALARYSSANEEKTGHFDINIGLKKWAFVTGATFSDFGDLTMGSDGPSTYLRPEYAARIDGKDTVLINKDPAKQVPTGYNQYNLMQKIRFMPNATWDIQYGFHYSATSDYSRYDRLIRYKKDKLRSAEWYYGPQIWMMNVFNIIHSADKGLFNAMSFTVAQQYFKESRHDRDFGKPDLTHRTETVDVWSANLDFEKDLAEKHHLFYGIELLLNTVGSSGETENIENGLILPDASRYPDGSNWNSYAAYVSYKNLITEKLTLQTGLRYNQVALRADFDTTYYPFPFTKADINTGALNGSAGIAYRPEESFQVNLNFSTGFRAPNIDDVGKVFESEPGAAVVPNPDLKPEYAYNWELGFMKTFAERVKLDLTGYYTILKDALVRRDYTLNGLDSIMYDGEMSKVQAIQNAAEAYVWGIHAGLEVKFPAGFGLLSKFNYQQGEEELDDGTKAPLRHAPPWFGSTHLTYTRSRLKADFYGLYNGEVRAADMPPSESEKDYMYALDAEGKPYSPGWYTLNIKVIYELTDYLMITAGLENITGQRYRPYSSGITAPGRNFIASVKYRF
ncbi:MAG: TonB-dependent receptor [Bacteroidales bacterium]|nr:TonB-dependent receptor [Bacteroidales bacterium]